MTTVVASAIFNSMFIEKLQKFRLCHYRNL